MPRRPALLLATCATLLAITWAYWPGLSGPFLFDDLGNLDALGAYGRMDHWANFLYYISSGIADPTGRPIAMLSFLLDAHTWPAPPWPFKRTNLVVHLVNTALLGWTVATLQAAAQRRRPALRVSPLTPLLAAALWGAHPLFVSTTLYVVQREAMLPMIFVLLALLAWQRAVWCFERGRARSGWAWAVAGMGGATLLAGFSKANGFLAPMLVGLAYLWFLRPGERPAAELRQMDHAAWWCLGVPSLLVLAYLAMVGWKFWPMPRIPGREWSLSERLLSEPRALWSYAWRLVLPRAGGGGLFVDDFVPSRGWLQPWVTLPAMLALAGSAVAAIALRLRFPIATFAWLFYLAAHLLEGTTIPLELYFEHRNYLPAMFLGWPLAHAALRPGAYGRYRSATAALLLAALLLLTHQRALVWGDAALLGALSATDGSESARAQVDFAAQQVRQGNIAAGLDRIRAVQHAQQDSVDIAISVIGMECAATGALQPRTLDQSMRTLSTASKWNYRLYQWLQNAAVDPATRQCRGLGLAGLGDLIAAAERNPQNAAPRRRRDLWHARGRIALAAGNPALALRWFNAALLIAPDPEYALVQAAALGDAGMPALGIRHLDLYSHLESRRSTPPVRDMASAHVWLLHHYGYYSDELSNLRERLRADAAKSTAAAVQPDDKDRR
ncbi:tetratricopeptide repeat protein [Cognatiluteimonas profundi]|uniref:tetratricopeptide repeat protein n=1 Tax=Cognatiluteimonas profundi TaxID=2594501 RepID=UPI00131AC069|nr:tetratricopeptide repeat protein [Lysobacter profundi]